MTNKRYGLIKDYTSIFKSRRGVKGIFDNETGYKYESINTVVDLLNTLHEENQEFKNTLMEIDKLIENLGSGELRNQYREIIKR